MSKEEENKLPVESDDNSDSNNPTRDNTTEPEKECGAEEQKIPQKKSGPLGMIGREVPDQMPQRMTKEERAELDRRLEEENERLGFTEEDDTDLDDLIMSGY